MKITTGRRLILTFVAAQLSSLAQETSSLIPTVIERVPTSSTFTDSYQFLFATVPGTRYDFKFSENLDAWENVPGYPKVADAPVEVFSFDPSAGVGRGFFKVTAIDEEPPTISRRFPGVDSYGVSRSANFEILLSDVTGVDPASISLFIGDAGPLTPGVSPGMTYADGVLRYEPGATPLAGFEETITVQLDVADTLNNSGRYLWDFQTEVEPVLAADIFVFNQADAPAVSWEIAEVAPTFVSLSYDGTAPEFAVGTLLANAEPNKRSEIFYRRITSTQNDTANRILTLTTVEVPLTEFILEGSLAASSESLVFETDDDGSLLRSFSRNFSVGLGKIGTDLKDLSIDRGGYGLTFDQLHYFIEPTFDLSFEVDGASLERLNLAAAAAYDLAIVPRVTYTRTVADEFEATPYSRERTVFLGFIGFVPIWMDVEFELEVFGNVSATASGSVAGGWTRKGEMDYGLSYSSSDSQPTFKSKSRFGKVSETILDYEINGNAKAEVGIRPELDFEIFSLGGPTFNVEPTLSIEGEASFPNGELEAASWEVCACAVFNSGLTLSFSDVDLEWLPIQTNLFEYRWCEGFPVGDNSDIIFDLEPEKFGEGEDLAVWLGEEPEDSEIDRIFIVEPCSAIDEREGKCLPMSVRLEASACGPTLLDYQWYHDGNKIPGADNNSYVIEKLRGGDLGFYSVGAKAAMGVEELSEIIELRDCGGLCDPNTGSTGGER